MWSYELSFEIRDAFILSSDKLSESEVRDQILQKLVVNPILLRPNITEYKLDKKGSSGWIYLATIQFYLRNTCHQKEKIPENAIDIQEIL